MASCKGRSVVENKMAGALAEPFLCLCQLQFIYLVKSHGYSLLN